MWITVIPFLSRLPRYFFCCLALAGFPYRALNTFRHNIQLAGLLQGKKAPGDPVLAFVCQLNLCCEILVKCVKIAIHIYEGCGYKFAV